MSGGNDVINRGMYDLLLYWAFALLSALIGKLIKSPPLLLYLILGAVAGNLNWVSESSEVTFFAEVSITIVFFSLGFEETMEHFVDGVHISWGIALIGALVPFGCGWMSAIIFFPDAGWAVHLTLSTAVTATAVSLTMILLQTEGLLKTRSAIGIMSSAVLDDVGCLILVSILLPVVVSATASSDTSYDYVAVNNVTGSFKLTGSGFSTMTSNTVVDADFKRALTNDIANLTNHSSNRVYLTLFSLATNVLTVNFTSQGRTSCGFFTRDDLNSTMRNPEVSTTTSIPDWLSSSEAVYRPYEVASAKFTYQYIEQDLIKTTDAIAKEPEETHGVSGAAIGWILGKVAIFFVIIAVLHKVVFPHHIKEGIFSKIPFVREYGIKSLISFSNGDQTSLIIIVVGFALGGIGIAFGFHPAIGAYFAGLILEEEYFQIDFEPSDQKVEEDPHQGGFGFGGIGTGRSGTGRHAGDTARSSHRHEDPDDFERAVLELAKREGHVVDAVATGDDGGGGDSVNPEKSTTNASQIIGNDDSFADAESFYPDTPGESDEDSNDDVNAPHNTMERARDTVATAAFMYFGPIFFIHMGTSFKIDGDLLATAVPQALGICAILFVGQWVSATLAAKYVPGGFAWHESALIGFGMLGRAELYFVVLNQAKRSGVIDNTIFFPMALAALFMNILLAICITVFKPYYVQYDAEYDAEQLLEMEKEEAEAAAKAKEQELQEISSGKGGVSPTKKPPTGEGVAAPVTQANISRIGATTTPIPAEIKTGGSRAPSIAPSRISNISRISRLSRWKNSRLGVKEQGEGEEGEGAGKAGGGGSRTSSLPRSGSVIRRFVGSMGVVETGTGNIKTNSGRRTVQHQHHRRSPSDMIDDGEGGLVVGEGEGSGEYVRRVGSVGPGRRGSSRAPSAIGVRGTAGGRGSASTRIRVNAQNVATAAAASSSSTTAEATASNATATTTATTTNDANKNAPDETTETSEGSTPLVPPSQRKRASPLGSRFHKEGAGTKSTTSTTTTSAETVPSTTATEAAAVVVSTTEKKENNSTSTTSNEPTAPS